MKILIDEETIKSLTPSSKIYMRGRNLYNAKERVGPFYYDSRKQLISAKVSSFSGNIYDTFIQLNNNGTVAGAGCSCGSFGVFKGPCKHVVALLFSLQTKEFPDEDVIPQELPDTNPLKGVPVLKQAILSFDVLERIKNPDEKNKSLRRKIRNIKNKSEENSINLVNSPSSDVQGLLRDETVTKSEGENSNESEYVKLNPGNFSNMENLILETQADGTQIIKRRIYEPDGEDLVKQVKVWNTKEENRANTLDRILQLDRLVIFEITLNLNPGSGQDVEISLRVGNNEQLYVINKLGEFIDQINSRDFIEFGVRFTWHKKQSLTADQAKFLEWLENNYIETKRRLRAYLDSNELLSGEYVIDGKFLSLTMEQLRSFFELDLEESEEFIVKVNAGGQDFPLVWRDTYPEELNLNLDLISELEENGETRTNEASETKNYDEDSETDKPKIARLGISFKNRNIEVHNLKDDIGRKDLYNSLIILPMLDVVLLDKVFYRCKTPESRLFYAVMSLLADAKTNTIDVTAEQASYVLGMKASVWEKGGFLTLGKKLQSKIIKEKLDTRIFIDFDGKKINMSVFFNYGDYNFRPGYAQYGLLSKHKDDEALIIRDLPAEKAQIRLLNEMNFDEVALDKSELPMVVKGKKGSQMIHQYYLKHSKDIFNFINTNMQRLAENARLYLTPNFKEIRLLEPGKASVSLGLSDDKNEIKVEVNVEGYSKEVSGKIIEAFLADKPYVRSDHKTYINLSSDRKDWAKDLQDLQNIVKTLNSWEVSWEENVFYVPRIRSLSLISALSTKGIEINSDLKEINEQWENLKRDLDDPSLRGPEVPAEIQAQLRPYQVEGYHWLSFLDRYGLGGILADEMGLGKTLQMLTFIWSRYKEEGGRTLIVAPTSLLYNWQREAERFVPELPTFVAFGNKSDREDVYEEFEKNDGLMIVSYGLVRQDRRTLSKFNFNYIVLDEAQYIKNPMTKTARAVKALHGERRFAMTGTPLENHIGELWSIFDFIMPGFLFTYSDFQDRFGVLFKVSSANYSQAELEEMKIKADSETDEKVSDADDFIFDTNQLVEQKTRESLRQLVSPFILRRLKTDVLKELPEKITTNIPCPMTPEQQRVYRDHLARARAQIFTYEQSEGRVQNRERMNILGELTRLRQICCDPKLFMPNYEGGSGKLDVLEDLLDNLISGGHRILLFSQFTSMLEIIKQRQEALGRKIFYIDGQVPSDKRVQLVDDFNAGEGEVFLISLKAGGTGLNLTGADVVIHYDPWWNPAVEDQATDRAHRIGQEKHVQVFRLVTIGSIEEKIQEMQEAKQKLLDDIVSAGATYINKMNMDDIKELFAE